MWWSLEYATYDYVKHRDPWLSGQRPIFGVVFFVSKCLLATEEQKNLWNVQFWPESLGAILEYVAYLPRFQRAQPVHVRVKSSCCCILREVVRFVRPRELVSFDPRHVTRFLQSENVFELASITKILVYHITNLSKRRKKKPPAVVSTCAKWK